jgi:hypothetical protein
MGTSALNLVETWRVTLSNFMFSTSYFELAPRKLPSDDTAAVPEALLLLEHPITKKHSKTAKMIERGHLRVTNFFILYSS